MRSQSKVLLGCLILIVSMFGPLGVLIRIPAVHASSANLVVNPGFESGLAGWSVSQGTATYSIDSTTLVSGCCSVRGVEINTGSLGRLYQDVTGIVSAGSQYQISGWIKTDNVIGNAAIALNFVAADGGTPADGYVMEIGYVTGIQDWAFYQSAVFTLPPMPSDANAVWFLFDFNAGAGTAWWDDVSLVCVTCLSLKIDIKPGSFPNSINLGSNGVVPVAIFGTQVFNVQDIDPSSVFLANAPIAFRGQGSLQFSFQDVDGNGILDMVIQVSTEALSLTQTDTSAQLIGNTFSGEAFLGTDSVRVIS